MDDCLGSSDANPDILGRLRLDAMLSDGPTGKDVFGEYVKKIVGNNAISLRL